jgi:hypothetical protein
MPFYYAWLNTFFQEGFHNIYSFDAAGTRCFFRINNYKQITRPDTRKLNKKIIFLLFLEINNQHFWVQEQHNNKGGSVAEFPHLTVSVYMIEVGQTGHRPTLFLAACGP